jgi:DNA-binding FadR family transcriptional regulator
MNPTIRSDNKTQKNKQTDWWAAVWRGLAVDPEAKHYRRLHSSLWLYIYLLLHAKWETGQLFKKYKTMATDMGVSERTIRNWMSRLKVHRYVEIEKTGRTAVITIHNYKTWERPATKTKTGPSSGKVMSG